MNLETNPTTHKNLNGAAFNPLPLGEAKAHAAEVHTAEPASSLTSDLYNAFRGQSSDLAGRVVKFVRKNPAVSTAAAITVGLIVARMLYKPASEKSNKPHSA
jgi:hypothetical protein